MIATDMPLPAYKLKAVQVADDHVETVWEDGISSARFPSFWLRIHAAVEDLFQQESTAWTDGSNFHPRHRVAKRGERIAHAALLEDGAMLSVQWDDLSEHRYPSKWLWTMATRPDPFEAIRPVPWPSSHEIRVFPYGELFEREGCSEVTALLHELFAYGIVMISDVPRHERSAIDVAERISNVDRTHLGDSFLIRRRDDSHHIGEVMAEIPLHIDLVYKQRPPDYQLLHALHQIGGGGENEFVDIQHLAPQLTDDERKLLATHPVYFVANSDTVHFRGTSPILVYDTDERLRGCRYNEYKIKFPVGLPNDYYFAFERFRELIRLPDNKKAVLLPQDHIVLFDNWRILHGRRSFINEARQIVGCFLSGDDLRSTYRVLVQTGRLQPPRYHGDGE